MRNKETEIYVPKIFDLNSQEDEIAIYWEGKAEGGTIRNTIWVEFNASTRPYLSKFNIQVRR